jgi:hypothetical protein
MRGICMHPHSGMNADEGAGSVQPEPSDSPPDCRIKLFKSLDAIKRHTVRCVFFMAE